MEKDESETKTITMKWMKEVSENVKI